MEISFETMVLKQEKILELQLAISQALGLMYILEDHLLYENKLLGESINILQSTIKSN
jgi:hypothetical protein